MNENELTNNEIKQLKSLLLKHFCSYMNGELCCNRFLDVFAIMSILDEIKRENDIINSEKIITNMEKEYEKNIIGKFE